MPTNAGRSLRWWLNLALLIALVGLTICDLYLAYQAAQTGQPVAVYWVVFAFCTLLTASLVAHNQKRF